MPHSPFTRYLGLAIVATYFLPALWLNESAYLWNQQVVITLTLVIGIFTWSAVRNAAPFDDRAFHRTLPPGDGYAFRRVLMIHGMVLAGIALSVVAYCWILNFGWRLMLYRILVLTIPVSALMAACGVAMSLSSSRQWGKAWGYIAIFLVPGLSATWLYWQHYNFDPVVPGNFYLNTQRTMVLTGAVLYPLIWWLVAAKRRWALGFLFGAATGALMPWICVYGGFFEIPVRYFDDNYFPGEAHVTISQKTTLPAEGKWLSVEEALNVDGLREGEFLLSSGLEGHSYLNTFEISDDPAQSGSGVQISGDDTPICVGRFEGQHLSWGKKALWNHLSKQVPHHEVFGFWNQELDRPTHLAILRPGESVIRRPAVGGKFFEPYEIRSDLKSSDAFLGKLHFNPVSVCRMDKVGVIDAATGGNCRLPEGGILRVNALYQNSGHFSISFRHYFQDPHKTDELRFDSCGKYWGYGQEPWVIAVDESGKHSFALSPLGTKYGDSEGVMLSTVFEKYFNAGEAKTREDLARMEMLRHCKLHVFWPRLIQWGEQ
jgi:hypothetical protein